MHLKSLKTFNSIKIGSDEKLFFTDVDYDLVLSDCGSFVHVRSKKTGAYVTTPITNTPWFVTDTLPKELALLDSKAQWASLVAADTEVEVKGLTVSGQSESRKDTRRAGKAKAKNSSVANRELPEAE